MPQIRAIASSLIGFGTWVKRFSYTTSSTWTIDASASLLNDSELSGKGGVLWDIRTKTECYRMVSKLIHQRVFSMQFGGVCG